MREPIEKLNKDYVPPKEHTLEFKETDHSSCPPQGGKVFFDSWKHFKSNNITGSLFDDDYAFIVRFDIIGPDIEGRGLDLVVTAVSNCILSYVIPLEEEDMCEVNLWLTARYKHMNRVWEGVTPPMAERKTHKVNGVSMEETQPIQVLGARSASGFGTYVYGPDKDGDVLVSINGKNEYINEHHVSPL